ncbi:MAG: LysM peptidoglycan-binding domain-containing protein, partial [Chloroflexota bacterium]
RLYRDETSLARATRLDIPIAEARAFEAEFGNVIYSIIAFIECPGGPIQERLRMFATVFRKPAQVIVIVALFCSYASLAFAQEEITTHVIQPGENLYRIALSYGLTTDELAAANNIADTTRILAGQTLVIPTDAPADGGPVAETLIAVEETTPVEAVPEAIVAEAAAPETLVETTPIYHTIQRGDNLRAIAEAYGTTEVDILELNNIANPNRILAGQQLLVGYEAAPIEVVVVEPETTVTEAELTTADAAPSENATAIDPMTPAEVTTHIVQSGEYISAIARRYGVSSTALIAANNITNPDALYAGTELVIPVGLTEAETEALIYAAPQAPLLAEREIVVDLSNSRVYAFENGILMYEAVSSNGLPATPTVQGTFTVQSKVRSQTMSGPGYWLPNVEWVMYFYQGYALHGAYWHNNWGQEMSHGCVNLTNTDAKWFYEFAQIGTPVTVQY